MDDDKKQQFEAIRPFGPTIFRGKLPKNLIDLLDNKAEDILKSDQLSKEWDHSMNLAGNVQKEIRYPPQFLESDDFKPMLLALKIITEQYLNFPPAMDTIKADNVESMRITSMWCVSQWAGDFNPVHVHDGDLSGVIYTRIPPSLKEEYAKEDHHPCVGDIQFMVGQAAKFSAHNFQASPEVGDIYIFPSWLSHTVYPFRTPNEERRSVSFNIDIIQKKFMNSAELEKPRNIQR